MSEEISREEIAALLARGNEGMTKEEAIRCLSVHSSTNGSGLCTDKQHYEAKQMAIKALEQEPCDYAISRDAVWEVMQELWGTSGELMDRLMALPSVNPQLKTEHWIPVSERLPEEYGEYLITWTTSQSKRPFIGISEGEVTSEYDHEHNRFKFEWLLEDYVKNYPDVKVLAWMPLPKPYEPQESEGAE